MGLIDKIIRSTVAGIIGILYFTNVISGTLALVLGVIAIVLFLTSFVSFCPMYKPFDFSTRKENK